MIRHIVLGSALLMALSVPAPSGAQPMREREARRHPARVVNPVASGGTRSTVRSGHRGHAWGRPVSRRHLRRHRPRTLHHVTPCTCLPVWRKGHHTFVTRQIRDPGHYERVWVPARFVTRVRLGCSFQIQVERGHHERVYIPGRLRSVREKIWVSGRYVAAARHCSVHR